MGLLSKANLFDLNKRLAFCDFITKYNIKFFSIFNKKDDSYYIQNSLGFDGISILESLSTLDFWNGICPELDKIYNFNATSQNNPLIQFFSFKIKDYVKTISVCKTSSSIFMLCNQEITKEMLDDYFLISNISNQLDITKFNNIISHSSVLYKFDIDYEEAIKTFIKEKNINMNFSNELQQSLFNELANRLMFIYSSINTSVKSYRNQIKTVFISDLPVSKELIINHFILNYKEVLNTFAQEIHIEYKGIAETFNDIKDFLKVE